MVDIKRKDFSTEKLPIILRLSSSLLIPFLHELTHFFVGTQCRVLAHFEVLENEKKIEIIAILSKFGPKVIRFGYVSLTVYYLCPLHIGNLVGGPAFTKTIMIT